MDSNTGTNNKRKEAILLILVLAVGLGGLAVLQFSRRDTSVDDLTPKNTVQTGMVEAPVDQKPVQEAVQKIPGDFLTVNDDAEAGTPYTFRLKDFSPDLTYVVDLGDGTRKPMTEGKLKHIYKKAGTYPVSLYAQYQDETVLLKTINKNVGHPIVKEKTAPIIDY
jgi:PKD domain